MPAPAPFAHPRLPRARLMAGLALGIVAADQVAKALIVASLAVNTSLAPIPALDGVFSLTYVRNTGMALSLLRDSNAFLILVSLVMIGVLLVLYHRLNDGGWWISLAVGVQMGGALGNLIDRLRLGYVVDYLHIRGLPIFNIADIAIVGGVLALAFLLWRMTPPPVEDTQHEVPCP